MDAELSERLVVALEKIALELRRIRSCKQIEIAGGSPNQWIPLKDIDSGAYD